MKKNEKSFFNVYFLFIIKIKQTNTAISLLAYVIQKDGVYAKIACVTRPIFFSACILS